MSPWKPASPCPVFPCKHFRPCPVHTRAERWPDTRPNAGQRGYGHDWRVRRARILKRDGGLCVPCRKEGRLTPAVMVDHIKPKYLGGTDDDANLRAICRRCHDRKTGQEGQQAQVRGGRA